MRTTFFSTLGKMIGFLVPIFIASWFGTTHQTDAFFFTYSLILFFAFILSIAVENVVVPYIAEVRKNKQDIEEFINSIFILSFLILLLFSGGVVVLIKPVVRMVTQFDEQTIKLIFNLLLEILPLIFLLVWTGILAGVLNAHKKFVIPAVSPAFRAVITLSFILAFKSKMGVHSIAAGYVAGEFVRMVIHLVVVKKLNLFRIRFLFHLNSSLRDFLKTSSYQVLGMAASGLNPFIDKIMASWLGEGSLSVLYYADRLYMIPITFMSSGLMVTLLSHWSQRYTEQGNQRLERDVKKALKVIVFLSVLISIFMIVFRHPIVKLIFQRGAFRQDKLMDIEWAFACYMIGFSLYMISHLFGHAHFVLKKTKVLMKNAFFLIILNIVFNGLLMKFIGISGIALSSSVIRIFSVLFLGHSFFRLIRIKEDVE